MGLSAGARFAGKFELVRPLAKGGMGALWVAKNLQLDVPIALKVLTLSPKEHPEFGARFEREAMAAARIRSPNVVHVYEHGVFEGVPFIVMELLDGEDLQQHLTREKTWPLDRTAHLVREVARVLHRAHEMGIVHRDLKPGNLFLARHEDAELVKVLDFGVAKLRSGEMRSLTGTGEIIGTMAYMSPEQLRGARDVDHRADLWSLAGVAFRALTGHLPFGGNADALEAILSGKVPVPSRVLPGLSPALDVWFAKAFARRIEDRFQTARELSESLVSLVPASSGASAAFGARFSSPPAEQGISGSPDGASRLVPPSGAPGHPKAPPAPARLPTPLIGKSTLAAGPAPLAFLPAQVLPAPTVPDRPPAPSGALRARGFDGGEAPPNPGARARLAVTVESPPSTLSSQVVSGRRRSIGVWVAVGAVLLLVLVWVVLLAIWWRRG